MTAPLQVGKMHVRNEEDRLSVEVQEGLEHCDVCPFVRGKQLHFNVRHFSLALFSFFIPNFPFSSLVAEDLYLAVGPVNRLVAAVVIAVCVDLNVEWQALHTLLRREICAQAVHRDEDLCLIIDVPREGNGVISYLLNVADSVEAFFVVSNVNAPLFGRVLTGVPVLPVSQLVFSAFVFSKNHHDHTSNFADRVVNPFIAASFL